MLRIHHGKRVWSKLDVFNGFQCWGTLWVHDWSTAGASWISERLKFEGPVRDWKSYERAKQCDSRPTEERERTWGRIGSPKLSKIEENYDDDGNWVWSNHSKWNLSDLRYSEDLDLKKSLLILLKICSIALLQITVHLKWWLFFKYHGTLLCVLR